MRARIGLLTLGWLLVCASVTAQPPTGLLSIDAVTDSERDPRTPGLSELGLGDARILVEAEQGGRSWRVDCPGLCEVALPPGDYRVTAAFTTRGDVVVSRVPVRPYQPSYLRIHASSARDAGPVPRIAALADGPVPPTFAAVLDPRDLPWPRVPACEAPERVPGPVVERRPLRWMPASMSAVWGDLREWWGHLGGTLMRPDGEPLREFPVYLERLDDAGDTSRGPIAPLRVRTTVGGCWGLGGLWPGRYRVLVEAPPFAHVAEVTLGHGGEQRVGRRVLDVAPALARRAIPTLRMAFPGWGRVTSPGELLKAVRHTRRDDLVDVVGLAVWWRLPGTWDALLRVDDVAVTWTHDGTGRVHVARTDHDGEYRLRLPSGVYRVTADKAPFLRVTARVIVTPYGHAVVDGYRATPEASGIWVPAATSQAGLLTGIHFDLALPPQHTTSRTNTELVTVRPEAGPPADVPAPLGTRLTRDPAKTSPWVSPLEQLGVRDTVQGLYHFTPGVVCTEQTGSLAQFSASGQTRFANGLTIDDVSANLGVAVHVFGIGVAGSGGLPAHDVSGGLLTLLPRAAIEDVTILTTNVTSSEARSAGAQTRIVTSAGGEHLTGALFTERTPTSWSASDWFDNAGTRDRRRDWVASGVSFGGPAPRGRFFFAWETQRTNRSVTMTTPVPSDQLRAETSGLSRAVLEAFPRATGPDLGDGMAEFRHSIPVRSRATVWSLRLDGTPTPSRRFFARASRGTSRGTALTDFAQLPIAHFDRHERTATTALTVGASFLSARSIHEIRGNVAHHDGAFTAGPSPFGDATRLPFADVLPESDRDAFLRFNLFSATFMINGPVKASAQRQIHVVDRWHWQLGAHTVQAGGEYRGVTAIARTPTRYTVHFEDLTAFLAGRARSVDIDFGGESRARVDQFAAFLEDDVRLSQRLSLQYGVRYSVRPAPRAAGDRYPLLCDLDALPAACVPRSGPLWNTSWKDVAPRVGVTYKPDGLLGRDTVIRAGWTAIPDEPTNPGASAIGQGFPYVSRALIRDPVFPLVMPARPTTFEASGFGQAYAFPHDLLSPRMQQWHASVDRVLGRGHRLAVGYVGSRTRDLPYWFAYDLFGDSSHQVHAFSDDASSRYHALFSEYVHRVPGSRLSLRATYTYGHAEDTDSGESAGPHRPPAVVPIDTNWGPADFDRPHVFRALVSMQLPDASWSRIGRAVFSDWGLSAAVGLQSGRPFNAEYAFDPRDDVLGLYSIRPDLVDGVAIWVDDPSSPTGRRVNRDAFRLPVGVQGTHRRNSLRASLRRQLDVSLRRAFRLGVPRAALEVQVDAYNILNILNAAAPRSDLLLPRFGIPNQSMASALGTGTLSGGGFTPLMQEGGARSVRLVVRFTWDQR